MIDDRKSENVEPNQEEPKVMSDQERDNFHGLTLNEDGRRDDPEEDTEIRIHFVDIKKIPLWKKILFGAAFVIFVAIALVRHGSLCSLGAAVFAFMSYYLFAEKVHILDKKLPAGGQLFRLKGYGFEDSSNIFKHLENKINHLY